MLAHQSTAGHWATTVAAVALVLLYWWAWMRRPGRSVAPLVWWTLAMCALAGSTLRPLEEAAEGSFLAHMVQHLLLWVVVPPLLLAAHPVRLARRNGLHPLPRRAAATAAAHPGWRLAAAWLAIVVTMYGTHLTGVYDAALQNQWVHEAEHVAYLAAAVLLWSSVLGSGRAVAPARAGLAAATIAPLVVLGMVLISADTPLYPTYAEQMGTASALADQRAGGSLMWLGSMFAMVPLIVLSVWRWAQREHDMQVRLEALADDTAT